MTTEDDLPWLRGPREQLLSLIDAHRLPHALMLNGVCGVGKSRLARDLARRLLCERAGGRDAACGECRGCRLVASGTHPDQRVLTPDEKKRKPVIPVADVRDIVTFLSLSSQYGGNRVAIIDPADALNISAANALLKTLEEPSEGCFLVLVTARPSRLPATVRSRCRRHTVPLPDREAALAWLRPRLSAPEAALEAGGGAPLEALALDADGGVEALSEMLGTLVALRDGRQGVTDAAEHWSAAGAEAATQCLWRAVAALLRSALAGESAPSGIADQRAFASLAETLDCRWAVCYQDSVRDTLAALGQPLNEPLALEALFADWVSGPDTGRGRAAVMGQGAGTQGPRAG